MKAHASEDVIPAGEFKAQCLKLLDECRPIDASGYRITEMPKVHFRERA